MKLTKRSQTICSIASSVKKTCLLVLTTLNFALLTLNSFAGQHIFTNGSGDKQFNNPANWNSGVVPGAGDTAAINANQTVVFTGNVTLSRFIANTGDSLLLNNYTLAFINELDLNGCYTGQGIIQRVAANNSFHTALLYLSNCTVQSEFIANDTIFHADIENNLFHSDIQLAMDDMVVIGNHFYGVTTLSKTGSSLNNRIGINTYDGITTINNLGSGFLELASWGNDTYNAPVSFNTYGTAGIYLNYSPGNTITTTINADCQINVYSQVAGVSTGINTNAIGTLFNGNVNISSVICEGGIDFEGCSLAAGKTITVAPAGFAGRLHFYGFQQAAGNTPITLNGLTSNVNLSIANSDFKGALTFTDTVFHADVENNLFHSDIQLAMDDMVVIGNHFYGVTTLSKTGSSLNNRIGINTYDGITTINNFGSGFLELASWGNDTYNAPVSFNTYGTAGIYLNYSPGNTITTTINADCQINVYSQVAGVSTGINTNAIGTLFNGNVNISSVICVGGIDFEGCSLAAGKTITVAPAGFAGSLHFYGFQQAAGNTSITLSGLTSDVNLSIANSHFTGDLTFTDALNNIDVQDNTFDGTLTLSTNNQVIKNNTFNGPFNYSKWGNTVSLLTGGNIFNGPANISNNGTGFLFLSSSGADTFNSDVTFAPSAQGRIAVGYSQNTIIKGNITVNGTGDITGLNAYLELNGTGTQSISCNRIYKLKLNKPTGNVQLNAALTIFGDMIYAQGNIISTNTNLLIFDDDATQSGAGTQSYTQGPVSKTGNDAFSFPLQKTMAMSAPASTGNVFKAQYFNSAQNLGTLTVDSLTQLSTCEYWTLEQTSGTGNVQTTLNWDANSCNINPDATQMRVARFNNTQWEDLGNSVNTASSVTSSVASNGGTYALAQHTTDTLGTTSALAIIDTIKTTYSPKPYIVKDSALWVQFTADTTNVRVLFGKSGSEPYAQISKLTLYQGTAGNLQLVSEQTFNAVDSSLHTTDFSALTVNQTYQLAFKGQAGIIDLGLQKIIGWTCGNEIFDKDVSLNGNQYLKDQIDYMNTILDFQDAGSGSRTACTQEYIIPIVFHLPAGSTIPDQQVIDQVQRLNEEFGGQNPNSVLQTNTCIKFCLAQKSVNTNYLWPGTPGITRQLLSQHTTNHQADNTSANPFVSAYPVLTTAFPTQNYLNVWVVDKISQPGSNSGGILGYSPYPLIPTSAFDGVVLDIHNLGRILNNGTANNLGMTLVHETGHYLGSYHTFQPNYQNATGTCDPQSGCANNGDHVCDTPPSDQPRWGCQTGVPSCDPNYTGNVMIENYMDYTNDVCMNTFTPGQQSRMINALTFYRPQLITSANYTNTGLLSPGGCLTPGLDASFTPSTTEICAGQNVTFTGVQNTNNLQSWHFDLINNGTTIATYSGTSNPPLATNVSFPFTGQWSVSLTVTDNSSGTLTGTQNNFFVVDCPTITNMQDGNWYFGYHAALSFATGIGVAVQPSEINTREGCTAISDNTGNLLFYTDGQFAWDNLHHLIPDAAGVPGRMMYQSPASRLNDPPPLPHSGSTSGGSAIQGALIVPNPANVNQYYIFTVPDQPLGTSNLRSPLRYSLVDMTLSVASTDFYPLAPQTPISYNSHGQFLSIDNTVPANTNGTAPPNVTEMLTAVPHCNGRDYWIIVHGNDPSPPSNPTYLPYLNFYAYLLDNTGLHAPVISAMPNTPTSLSTFTTINNGVGRIQVDVSRDGTRLAVTDYTKKLYLYSFDRQSGVIANQTLVIQNIANVSYGVSFSPDSKILYTSIFNSNNNTTTGIRQFDVSNFPGSNNPLPSYDYSLPPTPYLIGSYQLGPDDRMYFVSKIGANSLGIINYPNVLNTSGQNAFGLNFTGIPLLSTPVTQRAQYGLPNLIDAQKVTSQLDFTFSLSACSLVVFHTTACGTAYRWDFDNNGLVDALVANPSYTYTTPGTYTVKLTVDGQSVTHIVTIPGVPNPQIIPASSTICQGTALTLSTNPTGNNSWTVTGSSLFPNVTNLNQPNLSVTGISPGIATVTVSVTDANGCMGTTQKQITTVPNPVVNAGTDASTCMNTLYQLHSIVTGGTAPYQYSWVPPAGLVPNNAVANPMYASATAGVNSLNLTVTDANGCVGADQVIVTTQDCNCMGGPAIPAGNITSLPAGSILVMNNDINITGNLTILNREIRIAPGKKITVANGVTLTITKSHLYTCGPELWQGIVLAPNSNARIIINNNSLIEDAVVAVDVQSPSQSVSTNIVNISQAIFNKNQVGVRINNYPFNQSPYPFVIQNTTFTSRSIPFVVPITNNIPWPPQYNQIISPYTALKEYSYNTTNPLTETFKAATYAPAALDQSYNQTIPYTATAIAGLQLTGIGTSGSGNSMIVGEQGTNASQSMNLFDNLQCGIAVGSSNLTCYNNAFQQIITDPNTNIFSNGHGISAIANVTLFGPPPPPKYYTLKVLPVGVTYPHTNRFIDCSRAVNVQGYYTVIIQKANVRSTQAQLSPSMKGVHGFYYTTARCSLFQADHDTLTNIRNGITFIAGGSSNNPQDIKTINITDNIIQKQFYGKAVTDQYVEQGIIATNVLALQTNPNAAGGVTVNNNSLYNVNNGIYFTNWKAQRSYKLLIQKNVITMIEKTYPYSPAPPIPAQYGIYAANNIGVQIAPSTFNYGPLISDNYVGGFGYNNLGQYEKITGIYTSTNTFPAVGCNHVLNPGRGIEFYGIQSGTRFFNNNMETCGRGFVLNSGLIGQQGNANLATDNTWTGTYTLGTTYKAFTISPVNLALSPIYIRSNAVPYNPNSPNLISQGSGPSTQWYSIGNALIDNNTPNQSNGINCNTVNPPPPPCSPPCAQNFTLLQQLATDSMGFTSFAAQQQINAKHQVFRLIDAGQDISGSQILQNFQNFHQNRNIGKLAKIEDAIANGNLAQAKARLNQVTPANAIETNYKNFYTLYINYLEGNYSVADSALLMPLVNGCAIRDGAIVYNARALYQLIYNDFTIYPDDCTDAVALRIAGNNDTDSSKENNIKTITLNRNNTSFKLYPNPNNGIMQLTYKLDSNQTGEIIIYDLSGRLLRSYQLIIDDTKLDISEKALSNGIYFYQVLINKEAVLTDKIVIIKE